MNAIQQAEKYSVQEHEPKTSLGAPFWYSLPSMQPDSIIGAWGDHSRDRQLRDLYRNPLSWLAQSAVAALIRKFTQTPWQLKGGRNLTSQYQEMLQSADFNEGWTAFWTKVLLDYLTCDYGAYVEIIGAGRSDKPLRGRVVGIAHLDSLRCVPTGNLEYPVVYWSRRTGKLHHLHNTRVYRLVDMVDGDESRFGVGLCALSRAIAMVQQQLSVMEFTNSRLSNMPPDGNLFLKGISAQQYTDIMNDYALRRQNGYKGPVAIGSSGSEGAGGEYVPFSTAPDNYNYEVYIDIAVNAFCAAFGIDRQDIFPLTGKMSGTATQSEVMAEKAKGMAFGDLLSRTKRMMNIAILPPALEFDYEYRDEEKDKQVAERTGMLLNNANLLRGLGTKDETVMHYLAQQDETLRDVLLNENGELIALPDDDRRTPEQTEQQSIETDADNQTDVDADMEQGDENTKDITDTQTAFMERFTAVLQEARAGNINRRRSGILFRGMLRTFGGRAFADGLEEGGVPRDELSDEDSAEISRLVTGNSTYVSNLTDVLFNQDGITDAQAQAKAVMWYNKSISPFFDAGRMSADKNGLYEWQLGATEEHCEDCSYMNGQIHRLKQYIDSGITPKSSALACRGFFCECELIKRPNGKARGRMLRKTLTHHIHAHRRVA